MSFETPCCKKPITMDEVFNAISDRGGSGDTNKSFACPFCGKACIAYLTVTEIQMELDEVTEGEGDEIEIE